MTPKEQMFNQLAEAAHRRFVTATEVEGMTQVQAFREIVEIVLESWEVMWQERGRLS